MKRLRFAFGLALLIAFARAAPATDLTEFDRSITGLMAKYSIPGAAIAVVRDGKLVAARAYGLADREKQTAVQPDSLFRIGSISKTFTAAAIMKLVEDGRLNLDDKAFAILSGFQPPPGMTADPRLPKITISHLLHHTGGWDRDISGDPLGMAAQAARALHVPAPAGSNDLIRYAMGLRLDFDPGSRFAYSNLGYLILGRVIEAVSGMPYDDYVRLAVLAPMGTHRMRIGQGSLAGRADGEVKYYDMPGAPPVWTQMPGGSPIVPAPYAQPIDTWNSCGGWIASAVDLVRLALALDPTAGRGVLKPETLERMTGGPGLPPPGTVWYELGLFTSSGKDGQSRSWWHAGAIQGTAAIMMHRGDGLVYAAVFNSGPWWMQDWGDMSSSGEADKALRAALDSVAEWPDLDLFPIYQ